MTAIILPLPYSVHYSNIDVSSGVHVSRVLKRTVDVD